MYLRKHFIFSLETSFKTNQYDRTILTFKVYEV